MACVAKCTNEEEYTNLLICFLLFRSSFRSSTLVDLVPHLTLLLKYYREA